MQSEEIRIDNKNFKLITCNTVIVGSGAAGYASAVRLYEAGQHNICILTEGILMGTSRNTGSDKQTYYKLSLCGDAEDSVQKMAESLFAGKAVDGDLALCEAAGSTRCFNYLVELGVPFPRNQYGEFVGYQTDHDTSKRATSAGPLTSKYMTECLERRAADYKIPVLDQYLVTRIIKKDDSCIGLLALHRGDNKWLFVHATNVIFATGGPAGIYQRSVYPASQHGSTGVALQAGVISKNLMEWQYGIASIAFRWNLSGTYQQVLPRYYSVNPDGSDEREFLEDYYHDAVKMLKMQFMKGYQWPFDPLKVRDNGSSVIDMLIYQETVQKGRKVYMDFRRNPSSLDRMGKEWLTMLDEEVSTYLKRSGATQATPVERLKHMNPDALELYKSHNIDLESVPLQIEICAQHNNGGLSGDIHWESNLHHFFPVGEVNGSHGIHRPGGTALNAGQVGALKAAEYIVKEYDQDPSSDRETFLTEALKQSEDIFRFAERLLQPGAAAEGSKIQHLRKEMQSLMSDGAANVRSWKSAMEIRTRLKEIREILFNRTHLVNPSELFAAFELYDSLITAGALIEEIIFYINENGISRGSYLIYGPDGKPVFSENDPHENEILELQIQDGLMDIRWREIRPIPVRDLWFENVWSQYKGR